MAENQEVEDVIVLDDEVAPEEVVEDSASGGDVDSSDDDESESDQKKKKRKRGGNAQAKIKELWQREQDNKARMMQLEQEKLQSDQKAARYQEIAVTNAEANLAAQKKYLEQELQLAHEVADSKKIAKITLDLSQVQADESQLKRYKTETYIDGKPPAPKAEARQQEQEDAPGNDFESLYESGSMATKKWLDESRDWFDPDSDGFDEDKASDVSFYARNLERSLISSGRGAEIGTSGYYREIRRYVSDNYDEEDSSVPEKKTFNRQGGGAAPVTSRGPGVSNQNQKKAVTISGAERDLAVSLNLKHPNGMEYSDQEKIKAYISGRTQTVKKGA